MELSEPAIVAQSIYKSFKLPHEKQGSVKGMVMGLGRSKKTYEKQEALKDITFTVNKGDFFGIVGRNGSGKSTLLKLLAKIYVPDSGDVHVAGSLTPFIELGVGFNPELTGRENVFLNGALLGFDRKQMQHMYNDIVEFAEIEKFMDQKLKNYSSGMQVRLAFSIAIRAKSDILLIDEVLAVGDAAFQRKCFNYFGDLKRNKQTVIFVSHDMESVRKYCNKAVLIEKGNIVAAGEASKVVPKYLQILIDEERESKQLSKNQEDDLPLGVSSMVDVDKTIASISKVWAENAAGQKIHNVGDEEDFFFVKFEAKCRTDLEGIIPGVILANEQGEFITASNSKWANDPIDTKIKAGETVVFTFKMPNIYEKGDYKVSVNIVSKEFDSFYGWANEALNLRFNREFVTGAKANPKYKISVTSRTE